MPTHVILQPDPYLVPALLLLTGLMGLLLASIRGRNASRRRLLLRAGYSALAAVALLTALVMGAHRASLFWEITWQGENQTLVLDRPLPMGEVRIDASEVADVLEFSAVEHSLTGDRRAVRFQVRTRTGEDYWSPPLFGEQAVSRTRLTLLNATKGRLQRFMVGRP